MSKKKKEKEVGIVHRFWLYGEKHKVERLSNKITDYLFYKYGRKIGVMSAVFVPDDLFENAAERALERLSQPVPMPWGKNQSFTHGYNAAIRHAERVIREELTRHHGE